LKVAQPLTILPGYASPILPAIDRDGSVWWVTEHMLHHHTSITTTLPKLPSAHIESTTTSQDLPADRVTSIAPDPTQGVWLGTDRGLLYSDGVTVRWVPLGQDQLTWRANPRNIAVDTQGNAWIITAQGVQMLPAHSSKWQDVTDFGLGHGINEWPLGTIAAAREGGIWTTHGADLWRFGGSTITPLTGTVPLGAGCRLTHLTVDRDGNVWSPLNGCGVAVFIPTTGEWILYPYENGDDTIVDVFIGGDGVVYAGSHAQLYRFVASTPSSSTTTQTWQNVGAMQPNQQIALGADAQGGLWTVNCSTGDVWREQAGSVTVFDKVFVESTALAPSCPAAYRWYFDSRSWLWVYDGVNLFRYDDRAWKPAHQPNVGHIQDMTAGPDGRVWLVGDRGVAVYDPTADEQQ
jgi:ligand-binding sensor domain-containing protein